MPLVLDPDNVKELDAGVPQQVKRIVKSTYSPDDLRLGAKWLVAWLKSGPQADYATAAHAHLVAGDGSAYAAQAEGEDGRRNATKAGARFRTLVNHLIATTAPAQAQAGMVRVITGRHPTAANAFSWGAYWAPYEAPKARKAPAAAAK